MLFSGNPLKIKGTISEIPWMYQDETTALLMKKQVFWRKFAIAGEMSPFNCAAGVFFDGLNAVQ